MPAFKDTNGREWILKLDAPKIRAVRQELSVDLAGIDGKAFHQLADDEVLLVDALWILCREQANGTTSDQFGAALVGDPIEAATDALLAAILDFFPNRKRTLLKTLASKNAKVRELAMQQALEEINDPELEAKILAAQKASIQEGIAKALMRLNSAIASPVSVESVPTV